MPNKIVDLYTQRAALQIEPKRVLDPWFNSEAEFVPNDVKGTTAHFTIESRGTANTSALGEYAGPTGTQTLTAYDIEVAMAEYGEDPVVINRHWDLETNYDWFGRKVDAVAGQAIEVWNSKMVTAAYGTLPVTGNYVHATGIFDVNAQAMVYLGSDTTTETARTSITTTDLLTLDWVIRAYAILERRGVAPMMTPMGPRYMAFAHPNMIGDVKKLAAAAGSGMDLVPNTSDALNLKNGIIGDWQGFIWVSDPSAYYASTYNVFPILYCGADFLGIAKRPSAALPAPYGNNTTIFGVNEFMQLRLTPTGDTQGRLAELGFYFEAGVGILNPKCAFRHELYSANQLLT